MNLKRFLICYGLTQSYWKQDGPDAIEAFALTVLEATNTCQAVEGILNESKRKISLGTGKEA